MDKDDVKYLIEMSNSLAEMNGKLTMLCESLAAHEARISHLEDKQASIPAQAPATQAAPAAPASDGQNSMLAMALKALLFIAATAMALAGAGKFFAQ